MKPQIHSIIFALIAAMPLTSSAQEWAFTPPQRPSTPETSVDWGRSPIDQFVLYRLIQKQLSPSPDASRHTLIRRLTLGLHGLLPTAKEVTDFVNDKRVDAYEHLVDRLLNSPRYGERWAQHWLDVVRYADSDGFEYDDPRPHAWRFRDYTIASLNSDKPFDRFVKEQIAGDELYPDEPNALIGTGIHRLGPLRLNAGLQDDLKNRQELLTEMTDAVGSAFLGLTIGCARCHDHKFDDFPQADYFRLQSFFAATVPLEWSLASDEEIAQHEKDMATWTVKSETNSDAIQALVDKHSKDLYQSRLKLLSPAQQVAVQTPVAERDEEQQRIAAQAEGFLAVSEQQAVKRISKDANDLNKYMELQNEKVTLLRVKPVPPAAIMAVEDSLHPTPDTHLLFRGEPHQPREKVQPQFPTMLVSTEKPVLATVNPVEVDGHRSSGRRAALANWMVQPDNPLTARVFVNRVWQYHFAQGIVSTPNDFGAMGQAPTHPELLDWLTVEFIESGWSVKHLQKIIVTSSTYRQRSVFRAAAADIDPDNQLLWRMNRRRLEAEEIRDVVLQTSGDLNEEAGGPGVRLPLHPEIARLQYKGTWQPDPDDTQHYRRSIYTFIKRNIRPPMLESFDSPSTLTSCGIRNVSVHAAQALAMMNSEFMQIQAEAFARNITSLNQKYTPGQLKIVINRAYMAALSRDATREELKLGRRFIHTQSITICKERVQDDPADDYEYTLPLPVTDADRFQALVDLCHIILNLDDFMYVQ